jgi:hypothetical protein
MASPIRMALQIPNLLGETMEEAESLREEFLR